MDIDRPLFWHQGQFLQPQHFQLLERSFRSLLAPLHHFLEPHFWGIGQIEILTSTLGNRSFSPSKGNLLFPDGTYAVFPGNALVEARSFEEAWIEGGKPFAVYLGIKKWNDAGENVTVLDKLENLARISTRFVTTADPEKIMDLHSGGPPAEVKRLYYVLKIFWETEREDLGDYILVPIAQLERSGAEIGLVQRFIPPSLSIASSESLFKLVKEVRDQVAARSHQLEEYKRQKGIQTAEFGTRDMVYLLALRSLNRYAPLLFHFTETQSVHPWTVYAVFRQLIGELSTFSERINVLGESEGGVQGLPNYEHRNLWECFSTAQSLVSQLLDEITAGPEYVLRLLFDGTYYATDLSPAIFEARNRFYLVFKTEEDPKVVLQSLSTVVKISAREHLPILIARALPGIKIEHLPVPPQELPRRAQSLYFALDSHSDLWAYVEKGRNLALYWDSAPEDLQAELMVVGRT
jgi:type VI secretion system protein ImpJ